QGVACVPGRGQLLVSARSFSEEAAKSIELVDAAGLTTIASVSGGSGKAAIPAGGLQVAAKAPVAARAMTSADEIAVLNLQPQPQLVKRIPVGIAPFTVALSSDGTIGWVSNWGSRRPAANERTAPIGSAADTAHVLIDPRGVASSGTVSRVDLVAG